MQAGGQKSGYVIGVTRKDIGIAHTLYIQYHRDGMCMDVRIEGHSILRRTRASSQNIGRLSSYQVKLSRKITFIISFYSSLSSVHACAIPMSPIVHRMVLLSHQCSS